MKNVIPVFIWMLVILVTPHGVLENIAMVGLLVTGAIALYRTFKKPDTWATRVHRELRKAGIESEIRKIPNGKTVGDVLKELADMEK